MIWTTWCSGSWRICVRQRSYQVLNPKRCVLVTKANGCLTTVLQLHAHLHLFCGHSDYVRQCHKLTLPQEPQQNLLLNATPFWNYIPQLLHESIFGFVAVHPVATRNAASFNLCRKVHEPMMLRVDMETAPCTMFLKLPQRARAWKQTICWSSCPTKSHDNADICRTHTSVSFFLETYTAASLCVQLIHQLCDLLKHIQHNCYVHVINLVFRWAGTHGVNLQVAPMSPNKQWLSVLLSFVSPKGGGDGLLTPTSSFLRKGC